MPCIEISWVNQVVFTGISIQSPQWTSQQGLNLSPSFSASGRLPNGYWKISAQCCRHCPMHDLGKFGPSGELAPGVDVPTVGRLTATIMIWSVPNRLGKPGSADAKPRRYR